MADFFTDILRMIPSRGSYAPPGAADAFLGLLNGADRRSGYFDPYANAPSDFYYSPGANPGWGTPESGYFDPYASMPANFYAQTGSPTMATAPAPQVTQQAMPGGGMMQSQQMPGGGAMQNLAQAMQRAMQPPGEQAPKLPERKKTFDELHPDGTPSGRDWKDPRDPLTFAGGGHPSMDKLHGTGVIGDMLRGPHGTPRPAPTPPRPGSKPKPAAGGAKDGGKGTGKGSTKGRGGFGGLGKSPRGGASNLWGVAKPSNGSKPGAWPTAFGGRAAQAPGEAPEWPGMGRGFGSAATGGGFGRLTGASASRGGSSPWRARGR